MTKPIRLQLSRRKGFNLQAWSREQNGLPAMKADRSTRLGNPFAVTKATVTSCDKTEDAWAVGSLNGPVMKGGPAMWLRSKKAEALEISVSAFRRWAEREEFASMLTRARGHNLGCWCDLDSPFCHVDVLLELANEAAA